MSLINNILNKLFWFHSPYVTKSWTILVKYTNKTQSLFVIRIRLIHTNETISSSLLCLQLCNSTTKLYRNFLRPCIYSSDFSVKPDNKKNTTFTYLLTLDAALRLVQQCRCSRKLSKIPYTRNTQILASACEHPSFSWTCTPLV